MRTRVTEFHTRKPALVYCATILFCSLAVPVSAFSQSETATSGKATFPPDEAGYRELVQPFFSRFCTGCHGPDLQEGDFRLDQIGNDFLDLSTRGHWSEVVNVLNSHEMPPEGEKQPDSGEVARVVDWITQQMVKAELIRRDTRIVLRRLNRAEYRNTIRDLVGIDFDTSGFPQDPPAGGFDNNGKSLTLSPLHLELYYQAARDIFDQALVEGPQPPAIKWRFQIEVGDGDSSRVEYDGQRLIVHGAKNPVENGFKVIHHHSWDRNPSMRDFKLAHAGEYIIRVRAAGRVPSRQQVVESAKRFLEDRMRRQMEKNPNGEQWLRKQVVRETKHFESDRMYDYGPARLKLSVNLGGQPRVVDVYDVPNAVTNPGVFESRTHMSTIPRAGIKIEYDYSIPKVLENFWMQGHDDFARPELLIDWVELEGPIHETWPPLSHQKVLPESANPSRDERSYAREVLARFMKRAYRRPVSDVEIDGKLALFDLVRKESPSFVEAIKTPLSAVLVSPHFLYLAEPNADATLAARPAPSVVRGTATLARFADASPGVPQSDRASSEAAGTPARLSESFRRYRDSTGRQMTGRLIALKGVIVQLELSGGRMVSVPLSKFSSTDRAYIRALAARAAAGNSSAPEPKKSAPPTLKTPARTLTSFPDGSPSDTVPAQRSRRLNDFELASRLSYFLWSTMPDDELFDLAEQGRLSDREVLRTQVDRMLSDPKSDAFVTNFTGQWLSLREVGANPPAPDLYPRYDRHLEQSIVTESEEFFKEILHNRLGLMNFVKSDFVVINERLARFYGIPGVRGDHFRRVRVPEGVQRGGIVTQASILTITSNGTRTSPVKRGTWVMKNVLGIDPGLPVANAGDIAPKVPGLDKATVRQRLEIHRSLPQCARCHNKIDPLGFGLENFNAAGEWRVKEGFGWKGRIQPNDPDIDSSARMIDGTQFTGVSGLQDVLMKQQDLFLSCLSGKLFTYALGRELGIVDQPQVRAAVSHVRQPGNDSLPALIRFIVLSDPFLNR